LNGRPWTGLPAALLGGLSLAAATPPAVCPGAEFLVFPGLASWFAVATAARRPLLLSYVLGCVHMAAFSWSLRHVLLPAYVAIVVAGGLYFVFGAAVLRAAPRALRVPGFAVAVAASFWLRAVMPEVPYPHGQPCHSLWQWPALLGVLPLGGEALANALLGVLAAAAVEVWRSWRLLALPWPRAVLQASAALAVSIGATIAGWPLASADGAKAVSVAAIEPGVHPFDPYVGLSREQALRRYDELLEQRLLAPTRALLGEPEPPELVLWPESSLLARLTVEEIGRGGSLLAGRLPAAGATRLLLGANVQRDRRDTPAAVLLGPDGLVLGHQEKQRLVPGGEFLPFVRWLPDGLAAAIHEAFRAALGTPPDCLPGRELPPLRTASGVPFGALLCYDNAFPEPAAGQVEAGARFLCVLSNEAWYRGGGELAQLAAMTVCRALELRTPIVRCTTDGWSLAVDARGRVVADLPVHPAPAPAARILRVRVEPGLEPLPMTWLRAVAGPLAGSLAGLLLLCSWAGAVRRRAGGLMPPASAGATAPHLPVGTGS